MNLLRVQQLGKEFGGVRAVADLDFAIPAGTVFSIIGPNGAGKTTLLNLLTGVYVPSTGRIVLEERDLTGRAPYEFAACGIARTFQNLQLFFNMSALENVMVGRYLHERCGLPGALLRLPSLGILKGVMTVQVLKGLNVTTIELEHILGNLSEVLENVRAADPAANDSVQVFVELKNESKNLTKQFRDTLRLLLDNETIAMIKEQLKNITSEELQNCSMRLRHWIRQFNMNQLYRLYGIIGETNTSMIKEYINGNISLDLVKLQLHKMVNQMTQEKRHMIFSEIKEDNIKKKIHTQKMLEDMEHHGNGTGHGRPH